MTTSILKFLTCGSVDDGKSTLLGRMMFDAGLVPQDTVAAITRMSEERSFVDTTGRAAIDYSLIFDGLQAEREQGITIDVAWKYFQTPRRKFIVADCPGHEQYTRNMVTGASQCEAAVLLVDARKGVREQTQRHLAVVRLLGLRRVLVVINKLDLVDWDQAVFDRLSAEVEEFAERLGVDDVDFLPASALQGANLCEPSEHMQWYRGPTLLHWLETVEAHVSRIDTPMRMPVQTVVRPHQDFRGYSGTLASGRLKHGMAVRALPSGVSARVTGLYHFDGDLPEAEAGQPLILTLDREIDVSRGDMFVAQEELAPAVTDRFEANVVWFEEQPLMPGRLYELRTATATVPANVRRVIHRLNLRTLQEEEASRLEQNAIGRCEISTERVIACDRYAENPVTGSFIVVDRITNGTVGAGMITSTEARRVLRQEVTVDKATRAAMKGQIPRVVWFTGLSGSGKSTVANRLEEMLLAEGRHTFLLDGDNVRHGLCRDLGFSPEDRVENIRRVGEVAKLMVDAGLIVLVSFISPFRAERRMVRELLAPGEFVEVYVDTPLEVCEARDVKGLYRQAREGRIPNFTGISSPYEAPESPELRLDTATRSVDDCAQAVLALLTRP